MEAQILATPTQRQEAEVTYPWLADCKNIGRRKGIDKETQAKCKLSAALTTIGIGTTDGAGLVNQAALLPNFIDLNAELLAIIIYAKIRTNVELNPETGKIYLIDDIGRRAEWNNFFDEPELFDPRNGKIVTLYKGKNPEAKIPDYKMAIYRYLRLWFKIFSER